MLSAVPRISPRYQVPSVVLLTGAALLLMVVVSWAVLAAGWVVQGGGGAVVVALAAAAEAALLAQARVARIVAIVLAPVLALAAIIPTTLGAMPYDGDGTLGHTAARYLGALTGGLNSGSDWAFTVGLCAILWLTGYWLAWMTLRERHGVLAVVPLYAVLATNVLNARSPNTVALPEALAVALSLVVIAGTNWESIQERWSRSAVLALPGTQTRFAATVAVAVTLLTAAAVLIPAATSSDISARLFPGSQAGQHGTGGAGAATIEFNPGTVPGGALVSDPQPVLTYTADTAEPVYLGVFNDTQFRAGNWYPSDGGAAQAPGLSFGGLRYSGGALPRNISAADGAAFAATAAVHATITEQTGATGGTNYALFPGEPTSADHAGVAFGAIANDDRSRLLTVDDVELIDTGSSAIELRTAALVSTASEAQLRTAGTGYPAYVRPYTALQGDGSTQVATIAALASKWTAGTTNPYDAASAIEAHLRDPRSFQYTLRPPAAPAGTWPVVYFLTQSHRGYCQYFASAMGAMLRSLGIPARLVSGYGPGSPQSDASSKPTAHQQIVTTSDAHTWVEAFFPGYGWIPFEPTPPSEQGLYTPFLRGPAAVNGTAPGGAAPTPAPASSKPGFRDNGPAGVNPGGARQGVAPGLVLGLIAAALLMLVAASVLWMVLPRSPRGAWSRLEVLGRLRGERRRPGETHRQYAERIAARWPGVAAPVRRLAVLLGTAEFSPARGGPAARREAVARWRDIAAALPRLIVTRRPAQRSQSS